MLSDTVGFIHKLPPSLVKAFRSTLEEVKSADLLLHVVDCSDPSYLDQMRTTNETLTELNAGSISTIVVYNKADKCEEPITYPKVNGENKIYISAKEGTSLELLVQVILEHVYADYVEANFLIPFQMGTLVSYFRENATILEQDYREEGTLLRVNCHKADKDKYAQYLVTE